MTATHSARHVVQSSAATDKFGAILTEAVEKFQNDDRVQIFTAEGLREVISEGVLWRAFKEKLCEGTNATASAQLDAMFENVKTALLAESSLSGIQPIASLSMPIIRKAWPRIGIKEGLPTEPAKTPKLAIPHLVPYIKDPTTGNKLEIPAAIKAGQVTTSQAKVLETQRTLPLTNLDIMPAGFTVAAGYVLDGDFRIIGVDLSVKDSGNANAEAITNQAVLPNVGGNLDTKTNTFKLTVTGTHSSGNATSDTVYGYLDRDAGTITLRNVNAAATATVAQCTAVYLRGRIESTNNKKATVVGFDVKTKDVDIGTGEHFEADLPLEWLQDNMALYNIDGQLKVIDLLTEVIAQNTDVQGRDFLVESYANMTALGQTFARTFDIHPSGQFTGSPTDWIRELRRVVDNLANFMRDYGNFAGGKFVIFAHPTDACIIPGIDWQFGAMGDDEVDGVNNLSYSVGIVANSGNKYRVVASQNVTQGAMYMIFIPGQPDHMTYKYFPYTFNVMQTSAGFSSPNTPNVPAVMVTKRHKFYEFSPLIGKITLLNNDGSSPA